MTNYRYDTILWDMDGTLLDFLAAEKEAIRTCFKLFDMGECTDEMLSRYSAINVRYWECLERGEMTKQEILVGRFREFFDCYGLDISKAEPFNAEYQIRLGDTVVFQDDSKQLVSDLKGKVQQCMVTNGTYTAQTNKLKASGFDELFDEIFISDLIGYEKPSVEFFDVVFEKVTTPKDRILIVGDSLTSDIRGGNNAQIGTCWYNPAHKINTSDVRVDYEIDNLQDIWKLLKGEN